MASDSELQKVEIRIDGQKVEDYLEQKHQRALGAGAKHDFRQQTAATSDQVANIRRGHLGRRADSLYRPQETANSRTRHLSLPAKVQLYGEDVMEIKALEKVLETVGSKQRMSLEQVQQGLRQQLGQKGPKGGVLRRALIALAKRGQIVLWASSAGHVQLDPDKIGGRTEIFLQGRGEAKKGETKSSKPAAPTRLALLSALAELGPEPVPLKRLLEVARARTGRLLPREWASKQVRMLADLGEVERLASDKSGGFVPHDSVNPRNPLFVRLTEAGRAAAPVQREAETTAEAPAAAAGGEEATPPTPTQALLELVQAAGGPVSFEALRAELRQKTGSPCYPSWMLQSASSLERAGHLSLRARVEQQLRPISQAPEGAELYLLPGTGHPAVIELACAAPEAAEQEAAHRELVPAGESPSEPRVLAGLEVVELAQRLKDLGVRRFHIDLEF